MTKELDEVNEHNGFNTVNDFNEVSEVYETSVIGGDGEDNEKDGDNPRPGGGSKRMKINDADSLLRFPFFLVLSAVL